MALKENHVAGYSPEYENYGDEISLTDLVLIVWRNRWVAIVSGSLVLALAVLYLTVTLPVYQSEAKVVGPSDEGIKEFGVAKQFGFVGYKRKHVYDMFLAYAKNLFERRKFFDELKLSEYLADGQNEVYADQIFESRFHSKLVVTESLDKNYISIVFTNGDPDKAAHIVSEFIVSVSNYVRTALINNINSDILKIDQELSLKIQQAREIARQLREDKIVQLKEALAIARRLDVMGSDDHRPSVIATTANQPLYTRGSKALEAEIEVLTKRKSDDPFIKSLPALLEKLSSMQELTIKPDNVEVIQIGSPAVAQREPIRPRKKFVLAIGVLLAGFIGLFSTFVWEFIGIMGKRLSNSKSE